MRVFLRSVWAGAGATVGVLLAMVLVAKIVRELVISAWRQKLERV